MPELTRSPVLRDPIAYFLTWTTYGSWLPGDARGWTDGHGAMHGSDAAREGLLACRMVERPLSLDERQRSIVDGVIRDHCQRRQWQLHALNCRVQHVHVALTAVRTAPSDCMSQFKAWATRRLAAAAKPRVRTKWWTENGSKRLLFDERDLADVIAYITECQDNSRS